MIQINDKVNQNMTCLKTITDIKMQCTLLSITWTNIRTIEPEELLKL